MQVFLCFSVYNTHTHRLSRSLVLTVISVRSAWYKRSNGWFPHTFKHAPLIYLFKNASLDFIFSFSLSHCSICRVLSRCKSSRCHCSLMFILSRTLKKTQSLQKQQQQTNISSIVCDLFSRPPYRRLHWSSGEDFLVAIILRLDALSSSSWAPIRIRQ